MDFIERMFGVSPDGGDGTLELLCLLVLISVLAVAGCAIFWRRSRVRRHRPYAIDSSGKLFDVAISPED
jgi:hypothetical protein